MEAAVMVSLFLFAAAAAMKTGISLYQEVCQASETENVDDYWAVKDFYRYFLVDEVKDEVMETVKKVEN